jgi:hypothetical protein
MTEQTKSGFVLPLREAFAHFACQNTRSAKPEMGGSDECNTHSSIDISANFVGVGFLPLFGESPRAAIIPLNRPHCKHDIWESRGPQVEGDVESEEAMDDAVLHGLPADKSRTIRRGRETGAWLSILPLTTNGMELSAQEFYDAL